MLTRRTLFQLATTAGASLALSGRLANAQDVNQVLRIGLSTYPAHFRPWVNVGYAGQLVSTLINRNLLNYDATGKLVGELAKSWQADGDTAWKFTLRDAKFSNGQPVRSADVKWTLEKIAAKGSGAYMYDGVAQIRAIEIIDDRTFRLVTDKHMATIPALMAYPFLAIIAEGSTAKLDEGIGAGPYVIARAEKGVFIELKRSPHYFKDRLPALVGIRIVPYADESLRVAALMSGDVDLIDYVPWSAMDTIKANPKLKLDSVAAGAFMYLSFNGAGVFADARVRQAVALAVNRKEIVDSVFFGYGAELRGVPRPSTSPYYNKELAEYWSYNPDKAKALLKAAGHDKGLVLNLLATSQYTMHRDIAVLVHSHLAKIGVEVKLTMPDWATRVTMGNRGVGDFAVQGLGIDSLDPDAATTVIDPSLSPTYLRSRNFQVPGLSTLLAQGSSEKDEGKRVKIYGQVDKLVCEQATFCGLAYRATGFARSNKVRNLELLPDQLSPFSATLFDKLTLG